MVGLYIFMYIVLSHTYLIDSSVSWGLKTIQSFNILITWSTAYLIPNRPKLPIGKLKSYLQTDIKQSTMGVGSLIYIYLYQISNTLFTDSIFFFFLRSAL